MSVSENKPKKKFYKRPFFIINFILLLFLIVVLIFLPGILSSKAGKDYILGKLNKGDLKVDFKDMSLSWIKGIEVNDLKVENSTDGYKLVASKVVTKPRLLPLFSGRLDIRKTSLDNANFEIWLEEPAQQLKVEQTSNTEIHKPETQKISVKEDIEEEAMNLERLDLKINNADVKIHTHEAGQGSVINIANINGHAKVKSFGREGEVELTADIDPQTSKSSLKVDADYDVTEKNWKFAGGDAKLIIEAKDVDLKKIQPLLNMAGIEIEIGGIVSSNINAEIKNSKIKTITANVQGSDVEVAGEAFNGNHFQTKTLSLDCKGQMQDELLVLSNIQAKGDWFDIHGNGSLPQDVKSLRKFLTDGVDASLDLEFEINAAVASKQFAPSFGMGDNAGIDTGYLKGSIKRNEVDGVLSLSANSIFSDLSMHAADRKLKFNEPISINCDVAFEDKENVRLRVVLDSEFCSLKALGNLDAVNYEAKADLYKTNEIIRSLFPEYRYTVEGDAVEKGVITFTDDEIRAKGQTQFSKILISNSKGQSASDSNVVLDFDMKLAGKKIVCDVFDYTSGNGNISLNNSYYSFNENTPANENSLEFNLKTDYELSTLWAFLVVFDVADSKLAPSGRLKSDILMTGNTSGVYTLETQKARIENFVIKGETPEPLKEDYVDASVKAQIDTKAKTYDVDLKIDSPTIKIKFGKISNKIQNGIAIFRAELNADYDLEDVSKMLSGYMPENFVVQGKRSANFLITSQYPPEKPEQRVQNMKANLDIGFDYANYFGFDFGKTDLNATLADGYLRIAPFTTVVNNGKLNYAGVSDLSREIRLLAIPQPMQIVENVEFETEEIKSLIKYLNPIFADSIGGRGLINLHCERLAIPISGGGKKDVEIVGTVEVRNLQLQSSGLASQLIDVVGAKSSTTIHIKPTKFQMINGELSYDKMEVVIGDNPVVFSGKVLVDNSLDMMVYLPYTYGGKTLTAGKEAVDRIALPLKGKMTQPVIDFGQVLQQQTEQLIKQGLDALFK